MTEPLPTAAARRSFAERVVGSMRLDANVYEEIEHDPSAIGQAAGVVALAAVAAGIGGAGGAGAPSLVGGIIGSVLGWLVSTVVVWLIGVYFMKHTSDYAELLRTLGFASAPRMVAILGIVPILGSLAWLVAGIWGLVAYVIAVRQALDVDTGRAIVVCILSNLAGLAIFALFMLMFVGAPDGLRPNPFAP